METKVHYSERDYTRNIHSPKMGEWIVSQNDETIWGGRFSGGIGAWEMDDVVVPAGKKYRLVDHGSPMRPAKWEVEE